jgi:transposase
MPYADTEAMQLHLSEISHMVARGAHAVLLLDRAGWHTSGHLVVPRNLTLIFLPSRAPELNPVENVWQYLRSNWLSNRVFETYEAIIEAACVAWRTGPTAHDHLNRTARMGSHRSTMRADGPR